MSLPKVVSPEAWRAARVELLAEEKAMTKARDALSTKRRELPMVEITKDYVFEGPDGEATLLDLFDGRRQLIVGHFMFDPELGCRLPELHRRRRRDLARAPGAPPRRVTRRSPTSRVRRSRRSRSTRPRKGWTFPWYSSFGSDFNYDFHVTLDESVAPVEYNFRTKAEFERRGTPIYSRATPHGGPGTEQLPARRRPRLPHLLGVRPRAREHRRLVLPARRDRARPPGGLGGAEGSRVPSPRLGCRSPDFAD